MFTTCALGGLDARSFSARGRSGERDGGKEGVEMRGYFVAKVFPVFRVRLGSNKGQTRFLISRV